MSKFRISSTFILLILFLFSGYKGVGQEEDARCSRELDDRKVRKYLEKGQNKNRYEMRERIDYLKKALEENNECAPCLYTLAESYYTMAKVEPRFSYDNSKEYYHKVLDVCPDYHANAWFQLGVIYYGKDDYQKAMKYFQGFLDFKAEGEERYDRDYAKKHEDTKDILPEIEFYADFYNNPVPFDPRIVEGVSSKKAAEFLPMLSPDNELMFYTRRYRKKTKDMLTKTRVEEFTMSRRPHSKAVFDDGQPLEDPFNVKMDNKYGGMTISINNKEMYITVCKVEGDGYRNCDIYRSNYKRVYNKIREKHEYVWSDLQKLGPNVNTPEGWEAQPSLSSNGNILYYAVYRENSDKTDIYVSRRQSDGTWSKGESISDSINTEGNEKSPFMHSDSETLYFSSDSRWGAGGYDIFFTRKNSKGKWTKPENIGIPINTEDDEIGLIVSTDGKLAYFSSTRMKKSHGMDIYAFELPEKARPENVKLIKGAIKDENGNPVKGATVELKNPRSKEKSEVEVDSTDGKFAAVVKVEKDEDVVMTVKKEGYAFKSHIYSGNDTSAVTNEPVEMSKTEVGEPYRINDIHYATNSARLTESSKIVLDEFIDYLMENSSLNIAIHGHTDNVGAAKDNLALSQDRAYTVMNHLQKNGISSGRLEFKGFGESKPIATNDTREGRAKNRRTEFVVKKR